MQKNEFITLLTLLLSSLKDMTEMKHEIENYIVYLNFDGVECQGNYLAETIGKDNKIEKAVKKAIADSIERGVLSMDGMENIEHVLWEVHEIRKFKRIASSDFIETAEKVWTKYDIPEDNKEYLDCIDHPDWMVEDKKVKTGFHQATNVIGYIKENADWAAINKQTGELTYSTYESPMIYDRPDSHVIIYKGVEKI